MIKYSNLLAVTGLLVAGISTASATITDHSLIAPGLMSDFQDGTTMGWTNGGRVGTAHPPTVKQDGDNYYLETTSKGEPTEGENTHNQRLVTYNSTSDWTKNSPDSIPTESQWSGDYSNIVRIVGRAMATSDDPTVDKIHLRIGMSDWFTYWDAVEGTYPEGVQKGSFYTSNQVIELPTTGVWTDFSFEINGDSFTQMTREGRPDIPFVDALKNISEIRVMSTEEPGKFFGGDIIQATLGLDDIQAVSAVPLPGAVWLMISGLIGLGSLSSHKRL